jgi:hypothetical protein
MFLLLFLLLTTSIQGIGFGFDYCNIILCQIAMYKQGHD